MDWGKIGESVFGSVLGGLGNKAVDKVVGVPTPPEAVSGSELGRQRRAELDEYAPGTSPWERLGSNTSVGAQSVAETQNKAQMKLQQRELQTRERVSERTNIATILAAASPHGPDAANSLVASYLSNGMSPSQPYDSPNIQNRQRLEMDKASVAKHIDMLKQQIKTEHARTRHMSSEADMQGSRQRILGWQEEIARIEAKYAEPKEVTDMGSKVLTGAIGGLLGGSLLSGKRAVSMASNSGRRPDRFNNDYDGPSSYEVSMGGWKPKRKSYWEY